MVERPQVEGIIHQTHTCLEAQRLLLNQGTLQPHPSRALPNMQALKQPCTGPQLPVSVYVNAVLSQQ